MGYDEMFDQEDFGRRMEEKCDPFIGTMKTQQALENLRGAIAATLSEMREEGAGFPHDYLVYEVFTPRDRPAICFSIARNFPKYPVTEEEFEKLVGFKPEQDDLHRLNCDKVGQIGHCQCGWCLMHGMPRFKCGCRAAMLERR